MSDFGEGRHIVARKDHRCQGCLSKIPKGEMHYQFKGAYEGEWQNWRMHEECFADWDINGCEEFMPGDLPVPDRIRELMKA